MPTLLFIVLSLVAVYVACKRPPWFWAVFIGAPVLLDLLTKVTTFDIYAIPAGPVLLRATDIGFLGVVVGVLYQSRRRSLRGAFAAPAGTIVGSIMVFLALKVVVSVLFFGDQIAANRSASHVAGGIVAAIGDIREQLLPLIAPLYAFAARKSCNLRALGWPLVTATSLLLLKCGVDIALTGRIWTGSADTDLRYITSYDAIMLTLLSWVLFFLPVSGLKPWASRGLAFVALVIATLANHRSQWLGALAGLAVLVPILLLGRPVLKRSKLNRVVLGGTALLLAASFSTLTYMSDMVRRLPILDDLTIRLYAVTDPSRDPDAKWRAQIWQDRIAQVGPNWPWGRPLGIRLESLVRGRWLNLPDHNAYVSMFELGGVLLCVLALLFWFRVVQISTGRVLRERRPERLWPAIVALAITAASLAYGTAYTFPNMGPALAVILLLGWDTAPTLGARQQRATRTAHLIHA